MKDDLIQEWNFGRDKELADKLLSLVLSGEKTATAGLFKDAPKNTKVGDFAYIKNPEGERACLIQYTDIETKKFLDIGFDFVEKENEGHKTLEDWRDDHRKFYMENYGEFSDDSLIQCEEFILVEKY